MRRSKFLQALPEQSMRRAYHRVYDGLPYERASAVGLEDASEQMTAQDVFMAAHDLLGKRNGQNPILPPARQVKENTRGCDDAFCEDPACPNNKQPLS